MSDLMNLPGTFTPFYSYERSVVYPNGHRNILFAERGVPTLPIPQAEQQGQTGAAALYEYLKKIQRHRHPAHLRDRHGDGLARQQPATRAAGRDLPGRPRVGGI